MTHINIRIEESLKTEAQNLYKAMGMDLSTAINIFLRQSVQMQGLPFRPQLDPFYSTSNMEHLRRAAAALDAGEGREHELIDEE